MRALASTLDFIASRPPVEPADFAKVVELKPGMVAFSAVERLGQRLGVELPGLLDIIGIPGRTAARRREEGVLKSDEADRLLRVARVVQQADRVFGSSEKSALWLRTPHPILLNLPPLELLDSDAGAQAVCDELVRIEFGDFA